MGTQLSKADLTSAVWDCWGKSFNLLSNMGALRVPETSIQSALQTNFCVKTGAFLTHSGISSLPLYILKYLLSLFQLA